MSSTFPPRCSSSNAPKARRPHAIAMSVALPSTIAASTTCPSPDDLASRSAHATPNASSMPPPPKSPTHIHRRGGLATRPPEVRQRAGERDVVDVVAGSLRVRPVLAPARHAAVHELRVARRHASGPMPESLRHAGPEPFDERVGLLDHAQHRLDAVGLLEVDADRAPAAVQHLHPPGIESALDRLGAVDAHHVGAQVGEQHRRERPRPDARDLDDLHVGEWSHAATLARRCHGEIGDERATVAPCPPSSARSRSWSTTTSKPRHDFLVDVFGFGPGGVQRDGQGLVVHGEVTAGDVVIWLHRVSPEHEMASPTHDGRPERRARRPRRRRRRARQARPRRRRPDRQRARPTRSTGNGNTAFAIPRATAGGSRRPST